MGHLTDNEIIDFISMTKIDDESLKNASVVTSHIVECEDCWQKVKYFRSLYDEFTQLCKTEELEANKNSEKQMNGMFME